MENFFMVNEYVCIDDPKIAKNCKESEERRGLKRSSWEVTPQVEGQKPLINNLNQDYGNLISGMKNEVAETLNHVNLSQNSHYNENAKEVNLYDFTKSFDENFEHDKSDKYMLIKVDPWKSVGIICKSSAKSVLI